MLANKVAAAVTSCYVLCMVLTHALIACAALLTACAAGLTVTCRTCMLMARCVAEKDGLGHMHTSAFIRYMPAQRHCAAASICICTAYGNTACMHVSVLLGFALLQPRQSNAMICGQT
jgi:hypothetical protein